MATLDVDSAVGTDIPNSRKKRKKGRIIQKGYHKSEREDARRVAAKAFLSGIFLDSHLQPQTQPIAHDPEVNTVHEAFDSTPSRPTSDSSRHSNVLLLGDESLQANTEVSGEGRLYEIALDTLPQLQHSSPSRMTPSKSLDYNFGTPSPVKPVVFSHSASVFETQSERRQANIMALAHKRWQALDASPAVYHLSSLTDKHPDWLVDSRSVKVATSSTQVIFILFMLSELYCRQSTYHTQPILCCHTERMKTS